MFRDVLKYVSTFDTRLAEMMTATHKFWWSIAIAYTLLTDQTITTPTFNIVLNLFNIDLAVLMVVFFVLGTFHLISVIRNKWRYASTALACVVWLILSVLAFSGTGWATLAIFTGVNALVSGWAHIRLYMASRIDD